MVEESQDPMRDFPRMMLTGLGIAVSSTCWSSITVVGADPGRRPDRPGPRAGTCSTWSPRAHRTSRSTRSSRSSAVFAVANTALINMLMASRLLYGMANQDVLPRSLRQGARDAAHAVGRDHLHDPHRPRPDHLRRARDRVRGRCDVGGAAGWHDRAAAAVRVHDRQRRGAGAAHATRSTTTTSGRRAGCPTSARWRARSWLVRGRAATSSWSSTRSPVACSPSASCCGRSPGSPTAGSAPRRPASATSSTWRS